MILLLWLLLCHCKWLGKTSGHDNDVKIAWLVRKLVFCKYPLAEYINELSN